MWDVWNVPRKSLKAKRSWWILSHCLNFREVKASSKNGWMNKDCRLAAKSGGETQLRSSSPSQGFLSMSHQHCHQSEAQTGLQHNHGCHRRLGVCTKYIQAPDVVWNQPFKASLRESYDNWMAGDADKEYTVRGNLRAPARHLLVAWVLKAWDKLDTELVKNSFEGCVCVCKLICGILRMTMMRTMLMRSKRWRFGLGH